MDNDYKHKSKWYIDHGYLGPKIAVLHAIRRHGRCRAYRARPNQAFGPPFTGENGDQPTIDFLGYPISIDKPSNPSSCFQHLDWSFLHAENLWNQTLNRWSRCIGFIFWMFLGKTWNNLDDQGGGTWPQAHQAALCRVALQMGLAHLIARPYGQNIKFGQMEQAALGSIPVLQQHASTMLLLLSKRYASDYAHS